MRGTEQTTRQSVACIDVLGPAENTNPEGREAGMMGNEDVIQSMNYQGI